MIDMLKRHEVQVLRRAGHTWSASAALSGACARTVRRIARKTQSRRPITPASAHAGRWAGGRRPRRTATSCSVVSRVRSFA